MRLYLIQHHLVNKLGHAYNEILAWQRVLPQLGCEATVFINQHADADVIADTGGVPVFPFRSGQVLSDDPVISHLQSFTVLGRVFAETLRDALPDVRVDEAVIVPFSTDIEVHGVALWLAGLAATHRPKVTFIFHNPDFAWRLDEASSKLRGNISFHRFAAHQLKQLLPADRMNFYATNKKLAKLLTEVMQVPFAECSLPTDQFEEPGGALDGETIEPIHVGVMGHLRPETGSHIVAGVLENFCRARPGKRIFIQGSQPQIDQISARLDAVTGAECIYWPGALSRQDYFRRLQSVEIRLLPYMCERYDFRTSACFAEAVSLGLVCVAPARSWMARQLKAGWGAGVLFDEFTPENIGAALVRASDALPELRIKAKLGKMDWRQKNSATALVEQVIDGLRRA
ncbi:MAG: hypothetical protein O3B21_08480 [Proteobacteria bacterium]|nr:hypothetical protein [Pseudomonadota bacterium]MDA1354892.1 hypothetical protein [Pseudomonadota bacterium]